MSDKDYTCPHCKARNRFGPSDTLDGVVRCGSCRKPFRLPDPPAQGRIPDGVDTAIVDVRTGREVATPFDGRDTAIVDLRTQEPPRAVVRSDQHRSGVGHKAAVSNPNVPSYEAMAAQAANLVRPDTGSHRISEVVVRTSDSGARNLPLAERVSHEAGTQRVFPGSESATTPGWASVGARLRPWGIAAGAGVVVAVLMMGLVWFAALGPAESARQAALSDVRSRARRTAESVAQRVSQLESEGRAVEVRSALATLDGFEELRVAIVRADGKATYSGDLLSSVLSTALAAACAPDAGKASSAPIQHLLATEPALAATRAEPCKAPPVLKPPPAVPAGPTWVPAELLTRADNAADGTALAEHDDAIVAAVKLRWEGTCKGCHAETRSRPAVLVLARARTPSVPAPAGSPALLITSGLLGFLVGVGLLLGARRFIP